MATRTSASRAHRLPSRFPVGTRYVIEGRGGHVQQRYVEFPDGRQIPLPVDSNERRSTCARPGRSQLPSGNGRKKYLSGAGTNRRVGG
jgi:hypothetical protein